MHVIKIFKPAFPVQLKAGLNDSLYQQFKGQTITLISTFLILCKKCMDLLTSPPNQFRGVAEDGAYG